MSNVIFTYNEESALTAGQGGFINESGAYVITLSEAALKTFDTGSKAVEFSGETEDGRKVQYLSVFTTKTDGTENKFGVAIVQAIMGCTGIRQATYQMRDAKHIVSPEFAGKKVGLVLQKTLTSKQDGSDSYKFEIKLPFIASTRQTLKEKAEGKQAETVERMVATLKDKDDRKKKPSGNNGAGHSDYPDYPQHDDGFTPF